MKKDIPVPQEGAGRYFFLLKNHFWTLCKLNLLMLAASLPIVTIPAALCAGDRAAVKLARDGYVLLWEEFRDEFREDFWKSLPLGLLFGGLLAGSYVLLSFGLGNSGSLPGMLMLVLGILLAWYAFSRGSYAFLMRAMLPLSNGDVLKNAGILSVIPKGRGWVGPAMGIGRILLTYAFVPFSLLLLVTFGMGLYRFSLCYFLNKPIQEKIIAPWEAQRGNPEPET